MTRLDLRVVGAMLWTCVVLALPDVARAHPVDTASLLVKETSRGVFTLTFHAGSSSLQEDVAAPAVFPPPCRVAAVADRVDCGDTGLVGMLEFPWLESTSRRLLLDVEWLDGSRLVRTASAGSPRIYVAGPGASAAALVSLALDYGELGVEHILTGFDHLSFVVALTLLVRGTRPLLAAITAFTLGHSLSLAAAVLGAGGFAGGAVVEALIALSVLLLCAECLRPPAVSWTQRAPWLVTFAFGLLHGLGFASALQEVGLPEAHVPWALSFFNLGVELGQIAAVLAVLFARTLLRRSGLQRPWLRPTFVYAMGSVAAFWSIERVLATFTL